MRKLVSFSTTLAGKKVLNRFVEFDDLMDICLIKQNEWTNVHPTSIIGMLWLQTHFETEDWEALASKRSKISNSNADLLLSDAENAGLKISSVPSLSYSEKF